MCRFSFISQICNKSNYSEEFFLLHKFKQVHLYVKIVDYAFLQKMRSFKAKTFAISLKLFRKTFQIACSRVHCI